jgi:hypothetical protein
MNARMGAPRALGLGTVVTVVAAGLGVVAAPAGHADPVLPGPDSAKWVAVKKDGVVATDATNDMATGYLNVTPAGGALATSTAYISADLGHAYFRFHVAQQPGATAGGYVVQFDTDSNTTGWEQALRYDSAARTVTLYSATANSGVKETGTAGVVVAPTQTSGASYPGADGGAHVAFAVPRSRLNAAGIKPGAPMVMGTTTEAGAGLDAGGLLGGAKADIVGTGKFGLGTPAWNTLATDPIEIDSDSDGVADSIDNCPTDPNPDQEDFDAEGDGVRPPGENPNDPNDFPDGTEGMGDVCDRTPYGYDPDGDGVGLLFPDKCPERPGVGADGCPANDATVAVLRYNARKRLFYGSVRGSRYDECGAGRNVTLSLVRRGPDRQLRTVRSGPAGKYFMKMRRKPARGAYYVRVDRTTDFDLGLTCYADNSAKIRVR